MIPINPVTSKLLCSIAQQRFTEIDPTISYLNRTNYEIIQIRYKREQIAAKLFTKDPGHGT